MTFEPPLLSPPKTPLSSLYRFLPPPPPRFRYFPVWLSPYFHLFSSPNEKKKNHFCIISLGQNSPKNRKKLVRFLFFLSFFAPRQPHLAPSFSLFFSFALLLLLLLGISIH